MRLAFFLFIALAVGAPLSVDADSIGSQSEPLVRGAPVSTGALHGTVALVRALKGETPEDVRAAHLSNRLFCSGTLITPTTVLTAGHCVQACPDDDCRCGENGCVAYGAKWTMIAAGVTDLDSAWDAELATVSEVVLAEDYLDLESLRFVCDETRCTGLAPNSNDLAILRLASPIQSQRPVPLYPPARIAELAGATTGLAHGYGVQLPPESTELLPQDRYLSMLNEGPSEIVVTTDNELLTSRKKEDSAVCYGDSGGPLYVMEGNTPWLVGVASRLRGDARECLGGGVYALAPAYTDWIRKEADGALAAPSMEGGGCSVSQKPNAMPGLWLAGLLLFSLRCRRRAPRHLLLGALVVATVACGAEGDPSFCTKRYDPLGVACDPAVQRIDLQSAEAAGREAVPDDAWLWQVRASYDHLDPDGNAAEWHLTYFLPGDSEPPLGTVQSVTVPATWVWQIFEPLQIELVCIPARPIEPLDSRAVIHDTIRRLEEADVSVELRAPDDLHMIQNHPCSTPSTGLDGTSYRVPGGFYYLRYAGGEFRSLEYWEPE